MIRHPEYPNFYIYEGSKGEKPKVNAFYAPKKGDALIKIAIAAYGTANWDRLMWINKNPYNLSNGIYRRNQMNCNSRKATMEEILTMGSYQSKNQGWLMLCPRDKNEAARAIGAPYQVIWIPANPGDMPKKAILKEGMTIQHTIPSDGGGSTVSQNGGSGRGAYDEYLPEDLQPQPETAQAGMGVWIVGGLIAAGIVSLLWSTK